MPRDQVMPTDLFILHPETAALVEEIQREKYMQAGENSWLDTHKRVASGLFVEDLARRTSLEIELSSGRACPGGRVLAGAGTSKNVTWWNCFVAPLLQDSMRTDPGEPGKGIMDALSDVAYSMQMGGGVGTDFSPLRPAGALVSRVGAEASGPLAFMDTWDAMCRTIMSAGYRRGAMMATLRIDHPDILAFIRAKRDPARLRMFNVSVLVLDAFMRAKDAGEEWDLGHWEPPFDRSKIVATTERAGRVWYVYERVSAAALWVELMKSTYLYAEPGVIFIDRVNTMNNLWYCEDISCTNPCFTGDTKVWTVDGPRRFDELAAIGKDVVVLTELGDGKLAYRKMVQPRLTRRSAPVVQVTLEAKRGREKLKSVTTVRTTPDHIFYMVDGTEKRAGNLVIGDRIESAYRSKANQKGYIRIRSTSGDSVMEHHLIADHDHGRRPAWPHEHGHHVDEIKNHNVLGNVDIQPASDHNSEHIAGDKNPMRRWYPNASEEERARYHENMSKATSGDNNGMFGKKHGAESLKKIGEKTTRRFGDPSFREKHSTAVKAAMAKMTPEARSRNHRVIDIKLLDDVEDVYCGTVPDIGRFFVSLGDDHYEGVLVSNCGEQPLPPDQNCNLSHVNLSRCVTGELFTDSTSFDHEAIERTARLLVRMSDNVIDLSPVPTEAQRVEALSKRRIGLGITGLANALMFLGQRYGSPGALAATESAMRTLRNASYRESIEIARELGPFPAYDRELYLKGQYVKTLPPDIRDGIAEHGIRNALLNTVAPTGTVSIAQGGNSSGGLEPVFLPRYNRKVLQPDGSYKISVVEDLGFRVYANARFGGVWDAAVRERLPPYMVTTADLTPEDHLLTQAAVQKYVDSAVSKTINVPTETTFDAFTTIYDRAYTLGCKGCTTYREVPDSGRGAVLTAVSTSAAVVPAPEIRQRPEVLEGRTYRLRWGALPYPMFLTVNDEILEDGRRIPYETFINSKAVDYLHWVTALTRMISAVMRKGGDLSFIPDELKAVWSARGGEFIDKRFVPSEVALIGLTIERHLRDIGYLTTASENGAVSAEEIKISGTHYAELGIGRQCSSCGALQVVQSEGCDKCLACGWSNCG